jgi:CrcB protein
MREALAVAIGGALGSVARWLVGLALAGASRGVPWATLAVNLAGSLALGVVLAAWPDARPSIWRLLLGVGFCGGFTTFSTLSAELVVMLERDAWARAAGYAAGSLVVGVLATVLGFALGRALLDR